MRSATGVSTTTPSTSSPSRATASIPPIVVAADHRCQPAAVAWPGPARSRSMRRMNGTPDAVVVGSGPNGLAAALRLAAAGLRVQVLERSEHVGGGVRSEELIRPGVVSDLCSAAHPMAAAAPFFREFDLASRGVRLLHPEIPYAHPLDGGRAALALRSMADTAEQFGPDSRAYRRLMGPILRDAEAVVDYFLSRAFRRLPTRGPPGPAAFGLHGLPRI